jgi:tripartite-type tricarboxylate transporter receptor subunit TctC
VPPAGRSLDWLTSRAGRAVDAFHTDVEQLMIVRGRSHRRYAPAAGALLALVLAGVTACNSGAGGSSGSADSASFYKGKTLKIIVPYGPGGGYDQWPRVLQPYLKKYLGVANIRIVNAPGGGGLIGSQQIYNAKPDGLTIGDTNAGGDVFDQIDGATGYNMDVTKYAWIGRPDDDPHVIAVRKGTYADFDALVSQTSTIKALATGKGSSDYNSAVIVYNAFKVPFQMVAAFSGSSDEKAAFLSGEGATASLSSSDIAAVSGKANAIMVVSSKKFDKLPGTPTVIDEAKQRNLPANTIAALTALSDVMDLGHAFFAPGAVPSARLDALRTAFQKSMQDPGLLAAAQTAGLYPGYESGPDLQKATADALSHKDLFTDLLKTSS